MHPLDGARERLKRADENIRDLNSELVEFLAPSPVVEFDWDMDREQAVITDDHRKTFEELKQFICTLSIKPRFSVLAGEIIHHLRSAFDHVVWQLSSPILQANSPRQIEFPVFLAPQLCGLKKSKMCQYCRKVEGVASASALTRIDSLQPYIAPSPDKHPLWVIHDMDIADKHRELILAVAILRVLTSANAIVDAIGEYVPWELNPRNVRITGIRKMDVKLKMSAQVTFGKFAGRQDEPIIPTLQNLLRFTSDAVDSFAKDFA
jgi:hypothetical protein